MLTAWLTWGAAATAMSLGMTLGLSAGAKASLVAQLSPGSWLAGGALTLVYATVGLFLQLRVPGNAVGWLFLTIGLASGLGNLAFGYVAVNSGDATESIPTTVAAVAWLNNFVAPVWSWAAILLVVVFPHGRPRSGRGARLVAGATIASLLLAIVFAVAPGPLFFFPAIDNPYGVGGAFGEALRFGVPLTMALEIALIFGAAWDMLLRYRTAESIERQQLKWFAFAAAIWAVGVTIYVVSADAALQPGSRLGELTWLLLVVSAAFLPIAAGLAILRYGLYQIDTIIGRTVIYGAVTAILAGLYTASIKLVQSVFVTATGNESDAALVITTLVVATSFTPVKGWLERRVERRYKADAPKEAGVTGDAAAVTDDALTGRMEEVARRVVLEVLETRGRRPPRAERRPPERDPPPEPTS